MAVAPLFVTDMATLRSKLRLSGVSSVDGLALIDEGVLQTRQELFRALGGSLISTLLATTYTDTPTTDAEYRRLIASNLEVKQVRIRLLDTMPVTFKDAQGDIGEQWNQEAAFRDQRVSRADRKRMEAEILQDIRFLKSLAAGSENKGYADLIEADEDPPLPLSSIWGSPLVEIQGSETSDSESED